MKLLIVDDDEISRTVLASMLGGAGLFEEIQEATDGEGAWTLLQDGLRPALCCCDLQMPRLDGLGLLHRARENGLLSYLPFLMISSAADKASVTEAAKMGASGFIVKPFSAAAVQRTVEKIVKESRLGLEESVRETCQRLGFSSAEVVRLTLRLREDANRWLTDLQSNEEPDAPEAALRKLRSACSTLGLHQCVRVLSLGLENPNGDMPAAKLIGEVVQLLEERASSLR